MDIIISRYKKDVNWSNQFKNSNVIIYDKSDEVNNYLKLPNIGRESHTILYHIINNYDNLPDYSCFLQDDPSDHMRIENLSFIEFITSPSDFFSLGNVKFVWGANGEPVFSWLDFKNLFWEEYFINSPNEIIFYMGGQFIVSRGAIHLRKKIFYEKILEKFDRTDIPVLNAPGVHSQNVGLNKMPWILEATWGYIFNKDFKSKYDN